MTYDWTTTAKSERWIPRGPSWIDLSVICRMGFREVKAEARKTVRELLQHSRQEIMRTELEHGPSPCRREPRLSCNSWNTKKAKTMVISAVCQLGSDRVEGYTCLISWSTFWLKASILKLLPWLWRYRQTSKCVWAVWRLPAPSCLCFGMPLCLNQMSMSFGPFSTHGDQSLGQERYADNPRSCFALSVWVPWL